MLLYCLCCCGLCSKSDSARAAAEDQPPAPIGRAESFSVMARGRVDGPVTNLRRLNSLDDIPADAQDVEKGEKDEKVRVDDSTAAPPPAMPTFDID